MATRRPTTIRLSRNERRLIDAAAEKLDCSLSAVVRKGAVGYAARELSADEERDPPGQEGERGG